MRVFTDNQLEQYRRDGYAAVPDFFTQAEVRALQAEVLRFQEEGLLRNVTVDEGAGRGNGSQNLQMMPVWPKSRLVRALPFHPKVQAAIAQLLGEPVLLHLDQIFLKPARHGRGTAWHQDNFYFNVSDPMMGAGMWIAIHDATVGNGTMNLIPGAWREALEHTRDPGSDHHSRCYPDEESAVAIEVPAGGALFFCYGLPHCTRANQTDRERAGLAMHYLRADYAPPELKAAGDWERVLINGPDSTGGEAEYGERIAGTWEAELEKALAACR